MLGSQAALFEADGVNKVVEIVDNALVEAVELRSFARLKAKTAPRSAVGLAASEL